MLRNQQYQDERLNLVQPIRSQSRIEVIGIVASLSAVMFGYSLKEITSISIKTIEENYRTGIEQHLLQGLLIAILPLGGLLGSLISKKFITVVTRRNGMHLTVPVLALAILLVQITTPTMLFVGRFLEGICIGYYVSIASIYLKEITPKSMRHITGSYFSLGKIVGVLLVIIIELLIGEYHWRFMLSVTLILAVLQSCLLIWVGTDTPYEWIVRGDSQNAQRVLMQLYEEQSVKSMMQQIQAEFQHEVQKTHSTQHISDVSFAKKKKTAYIVTINVCICRHFTGGNSLITTAGIIMSVYNQDIGKWTPLLINSIQFVSLGLFILFFSQKLGKKQLLVNSNGLLAFINACLIAALLIGNEIYILSVIVMFMIVYGGGLLSVVWSYPSEILPASETLIPNSLHWIALSLSTLAPSLVMSLTPNNEVYPCFIFFSLYSLASFIFFSLFAVQSNGLSYQQIIRNFKQW